MGKNELGIDNMGIMFKALKEKSLTSMFTPHPTPTSPQKTTPQFIYILNLGSLRS